MKLQVWGFSAIAVFAASLCYAQVDCSVLDPRVSISKEREAKVSGSVETLLKVAKAGGSVEGKTRDQIQNLQVDAPAGEQDPIKLRVLYIFCGMVANAKDIPTERKFELLQQIVGISKEPIKPPTQPAPSSRGEVHTQSVTKTHVSKSNGKPADHQLIQWANSKELVRHGYATVADQKVGLTGLTVECDYWGYTQTARLTDNNGNINLSDFNGGARGTDASDQLGWSLQALTYTLHVPESVPPALIGQEKPPWSGVFLFNTRTWEPVRRSQGGTIILFEGTYAPIANVTFIYSPVGIDSDLTANAVISMSTLYQLSLDNLVATEIFRSRWEGSLCAHLYSQCDDFAKGLARPATHDRGQGNAADLKPCRLLKYAEPVQPEKNAVTGQQAAASKVATRV